MKSPNITQAQIAAVIGALGAVLAIVYQAPERLQLPLLGVLGAIAVAWIVSDALVRHGRAGVAAAQHTQAAAEVAAAAATAHLDHVEPPPVGGTPA